MIDFINGIIPRRPWFFYAAFRLGTFMMVYFLSIGITVTLLSIIGVSPSFMLFAGIAPFIIFVAIRLSGLISNKFRPAEDYNSKK
jgi:ABC-type transport system involved in cytochrome c biogenesis permease component